MSGSSRDSYADRFKGVTSYVSSNTSERLEAEHDRGFRLRSALVSTSKEAPRSTARAPEPLNIHIDHNLAKNKITSPPTAAKSIHICLVDNSGSNRAIARSLMRAAGYIHAVCGTLANESAVAIQFFSDHCDGERIIQEVDYTVPGDLGEKVLRASIDMIRDASGGDQPEAIECALAAAANYDFGHVPKEHRHLYLVTDVVAHGMGYENDDGCPNQGDWRKSLKDVWNAYGSFHVIASGDDREMFKLQKQFLEPDRLRYDLMDLATGQLTHDERSRLVANALLLFMMRNHGPQTVNLFLMTLLEKWMAEPQYGSETLPRAKRQIKDFCQYLEIEETERTELLDRIFAGTEAK